MALSRLGDHPKAPNRQTELGPAPESPICGPRANITESLSSWMRASLFWEESPERTTPGRLVLILQLLMPPDNTQRRCLSSSQ